MQLKYHILDVFTQNQMEGNPLAVVLEADYLETWMMQKIADEFSLSETVFVSKPKAGRNTAGVRIFTPEKELPFAGHPIVGAAILLGLNRRSAAIRLEVQIGIVTCIMDRLKKNSGEARFKLPQFPRNIRSAPETGAIARTLGLNKEQIGFADYSPAVYSAGVEYVLVPVRDRDALRAIKLEKREWAKTYGAKDVAIYAFCAAEGGSDIQYCARMFDLTLPRIEDPGTGSAAAALIGLLAEKATDPDFKKNCIIEQGADMGRTCLIEIQIGKEKGVLVHAGVGGRAVLVGEGVLNLNWHERI